MVKNTTKKLVNELSFLSAAKAKDNKIMQGSLYVIAPSSYFLVFALSRHTSSLTFAFLDYG